ncbi:hypothetical protein DFH06DRAFT_270832 [Mycena polygramma]|nr:hypothetical protein DFH06DRAFT_270832 [Mycena polygramma]
MLAAKARSRAVAFITAPPLSLSVSLHTNHPHPTTFEKDMSYPIYIRSRPCVPYVMGFSLSQEQMVELAKHLCTDEERSHLPDCPEVALNKYLKAKELQEGFLPYREPDGVLRFLWIKGVIPSFNGQKPKLRLPPVDYEEYPFLEGMGEISSQCIMWPRYVALPDWFLPRLYNFVIKWETKRQQQREAEKAGLEVH